MIPAAKLLHSSNMTYLPTNLPVQYYGLPDGKIYIVYIRFYDVRFDASGLEYVFAVHQEFSYVYEKETIAASDPSIKKFMQSNAVLDNPNPKFKIIKTYRNIRSFSEAFKILNKKAMYMLNKNEWKHKMQKKQATQIRPQIA